MESLTAALHIAEKKIQAVEAYFCEDGKKVKVEDIMKQILTFVKQLNVVMKVCVLVSASTCFSWHTCSHTTLLMCRYVCVLHDACG